MVGLVGVRVASCVVDGSRALRAAAVPSDRGAARSVDCGWSLWCDGGTSAAVRDNPPCARLHEISLICDLFCVTVNCGASVNRDTL